MHIAGSAIPAIDIDDNVFAAGRMLVTKISSRLARFSHENLKTFTALRLVGLVLWRSVRGDAAGGGIERN